MCHCSFFVIFVPLWDPEFADSFSNFGSDLVLRGAVGGSFRACCPKVFVVAGTLMLASLRRW